MADEAEDAPDEFEVGLYRVGEEQEVLSVLAECHPATWGKSGLRLWRWKHLERPGFDPREVVLGRRDGRIVGCFHGAILPIRIAPGITVPMSYDGDYAVLQEARGNDLTGQTYALTDPTLAQRGVALRGGFTSRELNERHYGKKYGYVFIPSATGWFRKFLSLDPLHGKLAELGERVLVHDRLRKALTAYPFSVGLTIDGLPEAVLNCSGEGFILSQAPVRTASVSVELPYRVLAALPDGVVPFARRFGWAVLTRNARVRGVASALIRLIRLGLAIILPVRRAE